MVSQHDQWKILGGIAHHKSRPQNMCHTHSWPQHVWYIVGLRVISSQILVRWRWPRRRPPGVPLHPWYPDYMLSWHGDSPTQTHIYHMMYTQTPARQVLYADLLHSVNHVLGIQTSNLKFPPVWIKKNWGSDKVLLQILGILVGSFLGCSHWQVQTDRPVLSEIYEFWSSLIFCPGQTDGWTDGRTDRWTDRLKVQTAHVGSIKFHWWPDTPNASFEDVCLCMYILQLPCILYDTLFFPRNRNIPKQHLRDSGTTEKCFRTGIVWRPPICRISSLSSYIYYVSVFSIISFNGWGGEAWEFCGKESVALPHKTQNLWRDYRPPRRWILGIKRRIKGDPYW